MEENLLIRSFLFRDRNKISIIRGQHSQYIMLTCVITILLLGGFCQGFNFSIKDDYLRNIKCESSAPNSYIDIKMSIGQQPSLNEAMNVTSIIKFFINVSQVQIQITKTDGIQYLGGDLNWNGNVHQNETIILTTLLMITKTGDQEISTIVTDKSGYKEIRTLYFDIGVNDKNVYVGDNFKPYNGKELPTIKIEDNTISERNSRGNRNSTLSSLSSITISGKEFYRDESNVNNIEIKYAKVELWRKGWPWDNNEQTTYTDANGYYQFSPCSPGELKVNIISESYGNSGYDVAQIVSPGVFGSTYVWTTDWLNINTDKYLLYTCVGSERSVWHVYNNMVDEFIWLKDKTGWNRPRIKVSCFEGDNSIYHPMGWPFEPYINIAPTHQWGDWARTVHLHEYAHSIMHATGFLPSGPGPKPHYIDSVSSPEFAICEGWAEFMACAVDNDPSKTGGWGSLEDTVWADSTMHGGIYGDWDGNVVEGTVASILWDLFDGTSISDYPSWSFFKWGDFVDKKFDRIWTIIKTDHPNSMIDFAENYLFHQIISSDKMDFDDWSVFYNQRIQLNDQIGYLYLDILNPTQVSPKQAGPYDNPSKISIEVKIRPYYDDIFIKTLVQSGDYEVKINGKKANVLSVTEKSDRYVLEVMPPTQNSAGEYDLEITYYNQLSGFELCKDSEKKAIVYGIIGIDFALCMDSSGSMAFYGKLISNIFGTLNYDYEWEKIGSFYISPSITKFDVLLETQSGDGEQYLQIRSPSGVWYGDFYTPRYYPIDYIHNTCIHYVGATLVGIYSSSSIETGYWTVYGAGVYGRAYTLAVQLPPTRINANKNAANYLVDLMSNRDQVSLISFSDNALVDKQLTLLDTMQNRNSVHSAINSMTAIGGTALGDGIDISKQELTSTRHRSNIPKIMILFTNGIWNVGSDPLQKAYEARDMGVTIYTIGFGSVDHSLLSKIASITGGYYLYAPTTSQLETLYLAILASVKGQSTTMTEAGAILPGGTTEHRAILDPTISDAVFSLNWGGSDLNFTLICPDNSIIDPIVAEADPNIEFMSGETYKIYKINSPLPGEWKLIIYGFDVPYQGENYSVSVLASTNLTMKLYLDKEQYRQGNPIKVSVSISDASIPITKAIVKINITKHNGTDQLILYDDGMHNDGSADDGIYANLYKLSNDPGSYSFIANAFGNTSSGEYFSRESIISCYVNKNQPPISNGKGPYYDEVDDWITFDGTESYDPDGEILVYHWNFGDGNTTEGITPVHRYSSEDVYNIELTVIDDYNQTTTYVTSAIIKGYRPVAVSNGPYSGKIGSPIKFNATGSYDPDGNIVSYTWFFGDGTDNESGLIVSHTYSKSGEYPIVLTVIDNDGLTDTEYTFAVILQSLPPDVHLEYPIGDETLKGLITIKWSAYDTEDGNNLPIYIYFKDVSDTLYTAFTGNPYLNTGELNWDTTSVPDGSYQLQIVTMDSNNNLGSDTSSPFQIKNHEAPPQNLPPNTPSTPQGTPNGKIKVEYTYTSSTTDPDGDQVYYLWDWGDGNTSGWLGPYNSGATINTIHKWTVKGSYSIKVKAKDIHGNESIWSDPLPITMPYSYNKPILQFLELLFQRFPHAFPILRHLLGY